MGAKSHNYPLTLFGMHHHWLDIRNWARGIAFPLRRNFRRIKVNSPSRLKTMRKRPFACTKIHRYHHSSSVFFLFSIRGTSINDVEVITSGIYVNKKKGNEYRNIFDNRWRCHRLNQFATLFLRNIYAITITDRKSL